MLPVTAPIMDEGRAAAFLPADEGRVEPSVVMRRKRPRPSVLVADWKESRELVRHIASSLWASPPAEAEEEAIEVDLKRGLKSVFDHRFDFCFVADVMVDMIPPLSDPGSNPSSGRLYANGFAVLAVFALIALFALTCEYWEPGVVGEASKVSSVVVAGRVKLLFWTASGLSNSSASSNLRGSGKGANRILVEFARECLPLCALLPPVALMEPLLDDERESVRGSGM